MAKWFNFSFFMYFPHSFQRKYVLPKTTLVSFLDLDVGTLKKKGKKLVIADLDNTLVLPYATDVSPKVLDKVKEIKAAGIHFAILSNHAGNIHDDHQARSESLARVFEVEIEKTGLKKPDKRAYQLYLGKYHLLPRDAVCIGDRILTDIIGANLLGIESILVQPLDPAKDPWFVKLSRRIEHLLLKLYR